jgi:hypothetical protein
MSLFRKTDAFTMVKSKSSTRIIFITAAIVILMVSYFTVISSAYVTTIHNPAGSIGNSPKSTRFGPSSPSNNVSGVTFMNVAEVTKSGSTYTSSIKALSTSENLAAATGDVNYSLNSGGNIEPAGGYFALVNHHLTTNFNVTNTVLVNKTMTFQGGGYRKLIVLKIAWNTTNSNGHKTNGLNYSVLEEHIYPEHDLFLSSTFSTSSGSLGFTELRWTSNSSSLQDLLLGDTINTTASLSVNNYYNAIYNGVESFADKYINSGNSTLNTLGTRYNETLKEISYVQSNLPSALSSQMVHKGSVATLDDAFNLFLCLAACATLALDLVTSAIAAVGCAVPGVDLLACIVFLFYALVVIPADVINAGFQCS